MKQFSFMLFLPLLLVMIILCFMKVKIIPFVAAISYPIGFIIADLFQINGVDAGGGATSNLWIIWTSVIATMIVASIVVELINSKKVKG
jgi:hypothetical protein